MVIMVSIVVGLLKASLLNPPLRLLRTNEKDGNVFIATLFPGPAQSYTVRTYFLCLARRLVGRAPM